MRRNVKSKRLLNSRRQNRRDDGGSLKVFAAVALAVAGLAVVALIAWGGMKLRALWLEQCVITDLARQVKVVTGAHVKPGVVLDGFALKNGENLALIDFKTRRQELLEKVPNIRSLSIARRLPDRVEITVTEREPVVRMGLKGVRNPTGRVADADGVVFLRRVGTGMLPTIREARAPGTLAGKRLAGRERAALELIMLSNQAEYAGLGILEVDVSHPDYLLATLGNYQRAKIAWEGMDSPSALSRARMQQQVADLRAAFLSKVTSHAVIWNATMPGRITADTKEPIL